MVWLPVLDTLELAVSEAPVLDDADALELEVALPVCDGDAVDVPVDDTMLAHTRMLSTAKPDWNSGPWSPDRAEKMRRWYPLVTNACCTVIHGV